MTVCNMTIEGGGRAGMIAPDDTTFEWVEGRPAAPDPLPRRRVARRCAPTTAPRSTREVDIDAGAAVAAGHLGHRRRGWSPT